jgi:hypothetical protein
MFVGPFADGPAQKTGVPLMQNVNDTVIIDVFSAFSDLITARRTEGDLLRYRLITLGAKFHKLFSINRLIQTIGPARPMGRGGLKRLAGGLRNRCCMALKTG